MYNNRKKISFCVLCIALYIIIYCTTLNIAFCFRWKISCHLRKNEIIWKCRSSDDVNISRPFLKDNACLDDRVLLNLFLLPLFKDPLDRLVLRLPDSRIKNKPIYYIKEFFCKGKQKKNGKFNLVDFRSVLIFCSLN